MRFPHKAFWQKFFIEKREYDNDFILFEWTETVAQTVLIVCWCVCVSPSACAHMRYGCVCVCANFSLNYFLLFWWRISDVDVCVCLRCVVLLSKYIAIIQQHLCAFSFVSLHFACRIRPKNVSCELFKRIRKFLCNYRMMCWQKKLKWKEKGTTNKRDSI